jgi:hypothetical protein
VTDREVLPGCARVRTKCAEKTSVGLWGQSGDPRELPGGVGLWGQSGDPKELPGVTCPSTGWSGCYNGPMEHI